MHCNSFIQTMMMTGGLAAVFAALCLLPAARADEPPPGKQANPQAVEEVLSGVRTSANTAWWGFDADDATECLQAAIDSGARRLVVPYMGTPWIVRPLTLRSGQDIEFEPGVLVLAKKGEFKGRGDSLFTAADQSDVVLRGYGATLRMRKQDYMAEPYEKAEWRMAIALRGCSRGRIEGLRLESSGGDGIYLGTTSAQPYCEDIVIRDVVCHDNHRQGISVISAVNLLIENCILSNTGGTAPRAGIDLEPNHSREKLVNCVIRNCIMEDNEGPGILAYLRPLSRESEPISVLFENCLVRGGDSEGMVVGAWKDDGPMGLVEFRNCTAEDTGESCARVYDKSADVGRVRFVNCSWKNPFTRDDPPPLEKQAAVVVAAPRPQLATRPGGVEFVGCHVYDDVDRATVLVTLGEGAERVHDLTGDIIAHNPHGARVELGPNADELDLQVRAAEE